MFLNSIRWGIAAFDHIYTIWVKRRIMNSSFRHGGRSDWRKKLSIVKAQTENVLLQPSGPALLRLTWCHTPLRVFQDVVRYVALVKQGPIFASA